MDSSPQEVCPTRFLYTAITTTDSVPVLIREDARLFRDEKKSKFTYMMTVSEESVMEAHREGHYNATILRFPMILWSAPGCSQRMVHYQTHPRWPQAPYYSRRGT